MLREDKYFKTLPEDELWQRYCSFLDLSVEQFMEIQDYLLKEQIDLMADSPLGKIIMNDTKPESTEEFRQSVPLTTYENYEPYLPEKQEDMLPVKPQEWCHSSGRGGRFKWIPYTMESLNVAGKLFISYLMIATASRRGDIRIAPGEKVVMHIPPKPYASWAFGYYATQAFSFHIIPPLEESQGQQFSERVQKSFQMALRSGMDEIASIGSIMVKVGEQMTRIAQGVKLSPYLFHPQVLFRLTRGFIRSRLQKRPMYPKDIWSPKCIITGGTDTSIYKESVKKYWGQTPFEMYGSTEVPTIAVQNWTRKWLTMVPYSAFWEFIPEEESIKSREDSSYKPSTVLLNELKDGEIYEIVLTQFHGMPLMRYRIGDTIKVVAQKDTEAGINLPQIVFHSRIGETIDLAGLTRLTEKVIWQAIANTKVEYEDWSVRKEYDGDQAYLRLFIELKEDIEPSKLETLVDQELKNVDVDYRDLDSYLEFQPVRVTKLSPGTFTRYYQAMVEEGADMAHLKPPHMNAREELIERLLKLSQ